MLRIRCYVTRTVLLVTLAGLTAGCWPGDVGVELLVSPDVLDFGAREDRLTLQVSKNLSTTPLEPVVARGDEAWILPEACTGLADNCRSMGPLDKIRIPVRVDRSRMHLGVNEGVLILESNGASVKQIPVLVEDVLEADFSVSSRTPEPGRAVVFTDLSVASDKAGAIKQRLWSFGDGQQSGAANPVHAYGAPGVYDVSLTVTTERCCHLLFSLIVERYWETQTKSAFITVRSTSPVAEFEADVTAIVEREEVTFTDLSTSRAFPIVRRLWQFGDGATSDERNPTHRYRTAGLYAVSLTVWTEFASDTETKAGYISVAQARKPHADFAISQVEPYINVPVRFTDLSDYGTAPVDEWIWDFGDRTDLVTIPGPGNAIPGVIEVDEFPENGDIVHVFERVGRYTVRFAVFTAYGIDTRSLDVHVVYIPPTAEFSVDDDRPDTGQVVLFTDESLPGTDEIERWVWHFGDSLPGTGTQTLVRGETGADGEPIESGDTTHVYTEEGAFTVTLTVFSASPDNNTDEMVKEDHIIVYVPPKPDFTFRPESAFTNEEIRFTNRTELGTETNITYEWNFDVLGLLAEEATSTEENPTFTYEQRNIYEFSLIAIGPARRQGGERRESLPKEKFITVDTPPQPAFSVEPNCPSTDPCTTAETLTFVDESDTDNTQPILEWEWDFGDGTAPVIIPDEGQPVPENGSTTHQYTQEGTYTVTLTNTFVHSGTGEEFELPLSKANYVTILYPEAPQAAFSVQRECWDVNEGVVFVDESLLGGDADEGRVWVSKTWDFGDGTILDGLGLLPVTHQYAQPGTYTVSLSVAIGAEFAPNNTDTYVATEFINVSEATTALDDYINNGDTSYQYWIRDHVAQQVEVIEGVRVGVEVFIVDLISQTWRSEAEYTVQGGTNSNRWQHYLTIIAPAQQQSQMGMLFISGGSNRIWNEAGTYAPAAEDVLVDPETSGDRGDLQVLGQIAGASKSTIAYLEQVPNERIEFADEAGLRTRTEDDIIAYTYDEFIKAFDRGDDPATYEDWPLLLPMVKSAIRAMDTVQDMYRLPTLYDEAGGVIDEGDHELPQPVKEFFVAGGSKRGWTTWLTAAGDPGPPVGLVELGTYQSGNRVKAIAPLVIDVLNMDQQMAHHFAAYGYWAPAIYSYAQERVFDRLDDDPAGAALLQVVDPFEYRCRLDMPKFIMNSSGDQFFLCDSSQWYFDRLAGEKYVNYLPNTDHGLDFNEDINIENNEAVLSLLAFYVSLLDGTPRPSIDWTFEEDGSIVVETNAPPSSILGWQAVNEDGRDFRLDTIGAVWTDFAPIREPQGKYRARIDLPEAGYAAFFVQVEFPGPAQLQFPPYIEIPFVFTTPVRVLPETEAGANLYPDFGGERYLVQDTLGEDQIPLVVAHGSPAEMGRQYGMLMQQEIQDFIPGFLTAAQAANPALTDEALDAAWNAIEQAYFNPEAPEAVSRFEQELAAVAEAAQVDFTALRRANMVPVLENLSGSAVTATRGATNRGWMYQSNSLSWSLNLGLQDYPCVVFYVPGPGHGLPHANVTFAGFVGAFTGLNLGGIGVMSVDYPDEPLTPEQFDTLAGQSYMTVLRDVLYDSTSIREAQAIVSDPANWLFRRQHIVVGDGRNLRSNFKMKEFQLGESIHDFLWDDWFLHNWFLDEYFPDVHINLFYSVSEGGIAPADVFAVLHRDFSVIDEITLNEINTTLGVTGANLVNVVYNSPEDTIRRPDEEGEPRKIHLDMWVSYANGVEQAAERNLIFINLQDYLP